MIFKIATSSILDIVTNNSINKNNNGNSEWNFEKRDGMLYIVVRAVSVGVNGNGDFFSYDELKRAYKTFIGKGVFVNHQSSDIEKKRGIIIDAKFIEDRGPQNAYVTTLMEINAEAFPELARMIRSGHASNFSMGCSVKFSTCSCCGNKAATTRDYCNCVKMHKGGVLNGKQVYEINNNIEFIECSLVTVGADPQAKLLEVLARKNGLEFQDLLQKAASSEDPFFMEKLQSEYPDKETPEEGMLKTDEGDVKDIETPSEKIQQDNPKNNSPESFIVIKIQNLIEEAAMLKKANLDNSIILSELNRWNNYYKQYKISILENQFESLMQQADYYIKSNIDCSHILNKAEQLKLTINAINNNPAKPTPYKMPKVNEYLDSINTGTGGHQTSKKDEKQIRKDKQNFKKNPLKDYE